MVYKVFLFVGIFKVSVPAEKGTVRSEKLLKEEGIPGIKTLVSVIGIDTKEVC